jgi:flagellar protein FlaF
MLSFAGNQAENLYQNPARAVMSDRGNEIDLFRRSITELRQVSGGDGTLSGENAEKISRNLQLWDALSVDILSPKNELPDDIKIMLINLGKFIRQHTFELYAGRGTVDVLIDINIAILGGLEGNPTEQPA